jgi:hypothetical protein
MLDSATIANTPASKADPSKSDSAKAKERDISTGSGRRAPPTERSPVAARPALGPNIGAKAAPAKEPMQKRLFVPAAKKAAVLLWGDDGLNEIASALDNDTRTEIFRTGGGDEWIESRHVIEWCLRTFEGPCRRDRNKMAEYVDRAYDLSYGVVRKAVVKFADPAAIVARLPGFWKQDYNVGELVAEVDPSGKGCIIRITGSPYTELVHTRAGQAEIYRYGFSQTRAKEVTESHALERDNGKQVLVIRLRWK